MCGGRGFHCHVDMHVYDYALVEKGAHNLVQLGMRKNMCGDTRTCAYTPCQNLRHILQGC